MFRILNKFTKSCRGSNVISFWLRKQIEMIPVKRRLGQSLAGLTFVAAVIIPGTNALASQTKLNLETQQTTVEVVPTQEAVRWPLSKFGLSQKYRAGHPALDLTAPGGTPVFPISDGIVLWVNNYAFGYGKHLLVDHKNGLRSLYAHLSSVNVAKDQSISKDTVLGGIGATGWATGNHLHLEVYQDGAPVNPLEILPSYK